MIREEFEPLALAILDRLYGYALRLAQDNDHAADLVQQTFVRALEHLDSFSEPDSVRPTLFRILHNLFVDEWRRRKRRPTLISLDTIDDPVESATSAVAILTGVSSQRLRDAMSGEVDAALNSLEEAQRETLWLREMEDYSYEEIGNIMQVPVGTVRSRLSRARIRMAESLAAFARLQPGLEKPRQGREGASQ